MTVPRCKYRAVGETVSLAAANNAAWCDVVCQGHGLDGSFYRDYWIQDELVVPLYPNFITLTAGGVDTQLAAIEAALNTGRPSRWFVKDSFNQLPLQELGFSVLFDAEWFVLAPPDVNTSREVLTHRAQTDDELRQWESAWGQTPADWPYGDRVFAPALLSDPRVAFLFEKHHDKIVAGLIANEASGVIGISNWFTRTDARHDVLAYLTPALTRWPSMPIVGYTGRPELGSLTTAGAQPCGPCRVWTPSGAGFR